MSPHTRQEHRPVTDPYQHTESFARAFNSGSADAVLETLAPGAVFVQEPGKQLSGEEARQAIAGFLSLGLPMRIKDRHVYVADDIALVIADWTVEGEGPDGRPLHLSGTSTDVIRRNAEGHWLSVIDNPNGTARPA